MRWFIFTCLGQFIVLFRLPVRWDILPIRLGSEPKRWGSEPKYLCLIINNYALR